MFCWLFVTILIYTTGLARFSLGRRIKDNNYPVSSWNGTLGPATKADYYFLEGVQEPSGQSMRLLRNSSDRFARQVIFEEEEPSKNYRRYHFGGNRRDGRGYGSGGTAFTNTQLLKNGLNLMSITTDSRVFLCVSAFAFSSAGGGWAGAGNGGGGYGKGWNSKGNKHYNPSLNKYGGGGPLAFIPSKGSGGATSFASASGGASASGEGPGNGVAVVETQVQIVTCDSGDKCHSFVHCAAHSYTYFRAKERCCLLQKQNKGMCCEANYPTESTAGKHFNPYPTDKVAVPDISQSSLAAAAKKGYEYKEKYNQIEDRLLELNLVVQKGTPAYGHLQFFQVRHSTLLTKL